MSWLQTLITTDDEAGYELAIRLSRMAVITIQPDDDVRENCETTKQMISIALFKPQWSLQQIFNKLCQPIIIGVTKLPNTNFKNMSRLLNSVSYQHLPEHPGVGCAITCYSLLVVRYEFCYLPRLIA